MFNTMKPIKSLMALFILVAFHSSSALAGNTLIMGQKAEEGFRGGYRIQFNIQTGKIIAIFDMHKTFNDGMLTGGPTDITHIDIPSTGIIQWEKYDISQSYIDLGDYSLSNYTIVMASP